MVELAGAMAAWIARGEGKTDEALRLMRAAADAEDATEKHPVTPGPIVPARELLGEMLLDARELQKVVLNLLLNAIDAMPDGRVIDASGIPQSRLTAVGPMLRAVLWETTAIPEIREQALREAER